jgi:hypothetical protein
MRLGGEVGRGNRVGGWVKGEIGRERVRHVCGREGEGRRGDDLAEAEEVSRRSVA